MIFCVVNRTAGSFNGHGPMVSQPGSASGRLNFSSPLKERGFRARFSEASKLDDLTHPCMRKTFLDGYVQESPLMFHPIIGFLNGSLGQSPFPSCAFPLHLIDKTPFWVAPKNRLVIDLNPPR